MPTNGFEVQFSNVPLIGDEAPEFSAMTTKGPVNFPEDYRGKWVILFSHPADFTPVCTSELMTFAAMQEDFRKLNTELLGISVDSISSHLAWIKKMEDELEFNGMKNIKIDYPIVADVKMEAAKKYGMIQPRSSDTKAVRSVFFIDPKGIVRALIYYPMSNGRNFEEIRLPVAWPCRPAMPSMWRHRQIGSPATRFWWRRRRQYMQWKSGRRTKIQSCNVKTGFFA